MESKIASAVERTTVYRVEARNKRGELLWVEEVPNLVFTVGLNDAIDKQFKASSYTAAWYIGLVGSSPTFSAADTAASHAGWTEVTAYDEAKRQTLTLGLVSGGQADNSANKANFTINTDSTVIAGAFLISDDTKGGTSGVAYGGASFSASRTLNDDDTISVTVTLKAQNPA